ncbi:solute carrier family 40 member 1-like isoform X2 [Eschrichtius robustus]
MLGELNGTENSGNEEKETRTASTRQMKREKSRLVGHVLLFTQNASITTCCAVLMLVFSYRRELEQVWQGWFTVVCFTAVITLAALANLASTALTISIQKDWMVFGPLTSL